MTVICRERVERAGVCICVCERESVCVGVSVCVCVCEGERERQTYREKPVWKPTLPR